MNKKVYSAMNIGLLLAVVFLVGYGAGLMPFGSMDMSGMRHDFIERKSEIVGQMMAQGDYACCLEKPCTYCIEKTPGHGEGASCHCLDDVMNGRHPCGECMGEIMEGHGNRYLAPYFAQAIAEEVGEQHIDTLRKIMEEKYDVAVQDQM